MTGEHVSTIEARPGGGGGQGREVAKPAWRGVCSCGWKAVMWRAKKDDAIADGIEHRTGRAPARHPKVARGDSWPSGF